MGHLRFHTPLTFVVALTALLLWATGIASTANAEVDQITMDILHDLGLSRIPDVAKANVSQEEYERMTKIYLERVAARNEDDDDQDGDEREAKRSLLTFYNAGAGKHSHGRASRGRRSHGSIQRLRFPLGIPEGAEVDRATLRMLVHDVADADGQNKGVSVFEEVSGVRRLLGYREPSDPTWVEVDVTDAVKRAMWGVRGVQRRHLAIQVACSGCSTPALNVIVAEDGLRRRVKRNAALRKRTATCARQKQRCCLHQMEVNFSELPTLNFVVEPKSFNAGYCKGRCPPRFNPAHEHALLQWLVRNQDRQKAPKPCCAPSKLKPIDILYVDEKNAEKLKVDTWKNMRVTECACS